MSQSAAGGAKGAEANGGARGAEANSLAARAEILKLARLLRRDADRLAYLEQVPPEDLRQLREQVTEVLFTAQAGTLRRLAAASRLLSPGLVASLGQNTFGAMLSARIAGLLEAERAVEIAARMSAEFLAEVAIELDPRRAREVIAGIPPARILEITAELARRKEYVTMGRFVGHLDDDALSAAMGALDEEALSHTALVTEGPQGADRLSQLLEQRRLRQA